MSARISTVISTQHHLVPVMAEDGVCLDWSLLEVVLLELAVNVRGFVLCQA